MEVLFNWLLSFWNELWPCNRVQPWQSGLLVICGRWTKELKPGVYIRVPLLMQIETTDVVEQIIDLPNQILQTTDEVVLMVSGALQYHIDSIEKYYRNVQDPDKSLQALAQLEIASFIVHAPSDEVTTQTIEDDVAAVIRDKAVDWGIAVTRVGVTHLAPADAHYLTGDNTVGSVFFTQG